MERELWLVRVEGWWEEEGCLLSTPKGSNGLSRSSLTVLAPGEAPGGRLMAWCAA